MLSATATLASFVLLQSAQVTVADLPTCEVYAENQCDGDVIITSPTFEDHRWYTPAKGSKDYINSFQDYAVLAAHAHITYDATQKSATVDVKADHRDGAKLSYGFDGKYQSKSTITFTSTTAKEPIALTVQGDDGSGM